MNWKNLKFYMFIILIKTYLLNGCGIEVGNPTGETDNAGTVTISIADAPIDDAKHFYIYIDKLELVKIDGEQVLVEMNEHKKIDLLALQDGKKETISTLGVVPAGDYIGLFVHLSPEQESILINQDNKEIPVPFASKAAKTIYMMQEFKILKSKNTKLLIHVDLRQSVQEKEDGSFIFNPTFDIFHEGVFGMIKGSITNGSNTTICAYLYNQEIDMIDPLIYDELHKEALQQENASDPLSPDFESPPEELKNMIPEDDDHQQPYIDETSSSEDFMLPGEDLKRQTILNDTADPSEPHFPEGEIDLNALENLKYDQEQIYEAPSLPHFQDQQSITKDETNQCPNAYASVISKDGTFTLRYLTQGHYDLRIFYPDGTYKDLDNSIEVGYQNKRLIEISE